LHSVNADPAQIEQVLMNLAVNARDAMPLGGKLLICTKNTFLDESYCKTHMGATPGSYAMLQVSDTGHGMDSATLARIFEPFFSSKGIGKGTGLGLSMVYGIVSSHGGYISCESQPGEGTTFEIYLPTIDEAETKDEAQTDPVKAMKKGSETILLVDDEDYIRDLGNQILSKFGYSILMAENGQVALDMYRSLWKSIDLVLLDLIMPGISGTECLKELRTINPDVKVVVISGYSPDGSTDELFQLGARGFISKPYQMTQMLQVTREVLDSPTELH
jgi:CheY-like chemotaxis protein